VFIYQKCKLRKKKRVEIPQISSIPLANFHSLWRLNLLLVVLALNFLPIGRQDRPRGSLIRLDHGSAGILCVFFSIDFDCRPTARSENPYWVSVLVNLLKQFGQGRVSGGRLLLLRGGDFVRKVRPVLLLLVGIRVLESLYRITQLGLHASSFLLLSRTPLIPGSGFGTSTRSSVFQLPRFDF